MLAVLQDTVDAWKWDRKGIQQAPEQYAQLYNYNSHSQFPATWWQYAGSHNLNTHRQLSLAGICPLPMPPASGNTSIMAWRVIM